MRYEIVRQEAGTVPAGTFECWVVQGDGNTRLGETAMTCWFNPDFGFVKMNFRAINGDKIIFWLKKVEDAFESNRSY